MHEESSVGEYPDSSRWEYHFPRNYFERVFEIKKNIDIMKFVHLKIVYNTNYHNKGWLEKTLTA